MIKDKWTNLRLIRVRIQRSPRDRFRLRTSSAQTMWSEGLFLLLSWTNCKHGKMISKPQTQITKARDRQAQLYIQIKDLFQIKNNMWRDSNLTKEDVMDLNEEEEFLRTWHREWIVEDDRLGDRSNRYLTSSKFRIRRKRTSRLNQLEHRSHWRLTWKLFIHKDRKTSMKNEKLKKLFNNIWKPNRHWMRRMDSPHLRGMNNLQMTSK